MRWLAVLVVSTFLNALLGGTAERLRAEPGVQVEFEGDRLSVSAEKVPVKDIVAEIERVTPIKISGEARLDPQVVNQERTVSFRELKVAEAFRRLLPENNFVVVQSPDGIAVEIHAAGQGAQPAQQGAPSAAPAPPTPQPPAPSAPAEPGTTMEMKGDRTTAAVRDTALSDPDPTKRAQAMSQLSRAADRRLVAETALNLLDREREPVVLQSALDALGSQASVPVDPLLRFAANGDRDPKLRARVIELLRPSAAGNSQVQTFLRSAATQDPSQEVQAAARQVLEGAKSQ